VARTFWDVLGLAPTSDNRPEDDVLAFQNLREAREIALEWAKFHAGIPLVEKTDSSKEIEVKRAKRKSAPRENSKANAIRKNKNFEPQELPSQHLEAFSNSIAPPSVDCLHDFIEWITHFETLIMEDKVDSVMLYLRSATFDERKTAEERLLQAIESNFSKRVAQGKSHAQLSWNEPFNNAILKLDEEFEWAKRDRELAGRFLGTDLVDYLNNLRSHDSIFAKQSVLIKTEFWFSKPWWKWALLIYLAIKLLALLSSI
jgi:hypothetical protein